MENLQTALREFDALRDGEQGGDVVSEASLSAVAPTYADSIVFDALPSQLTAALRARGIDRLYQHQADAITMHWRAVTSSCRPRQPAARRLPSRFRCFTRWPRSGDRTLS